MIEDEIEKNTEEVFSELEKTQKDFWNISRASANFLSMIIKMSKSKNAVEVGTSNGYSGIWLGQALKVTGGQLTTIEYYEKRIVLAQENFKKCGIEDVITVKQGSALDVLKELVEDNKFKCDFLFIDANKREYIEDYRVIDKVLPVGGIIAADNVTSHAQKVT